MKKILAIAVLLTVATISFAQDCSQFVYMQKGKTIEMTAYNQAGQVMRKSVNFIQDVTTANGTTSATAVTTSYDKNGKSLGSGNLVYKCTGGAFMIDMNANMPQMGNAKLSATYIEYPAGMTVGQHFKDVETQLQIAMGGKTMNMTSKITDRTVVGKESITTPAGTWEAFKITYKSITSMPPAMGMPDRTAEITQWYVPNFGIVQFQVYGMTIKLTSIK